LYTNATPVPVTIGGIGSGTTFDEKTMTEMWDSLLYPYQSPSFTSFGISGQSTPIEVGSSVGANPIFTWAATNTANILANTTVITDVTSGVVLANNVSITSPYNATASAVTKTSATSNVWSIQQTNTNSVTFSRNYTVSWLWRTYYGESLTTPLVEADIEGLRASALYSGFARTYTFNTTGYKYICYPTVLGIATNFTDTSTQLQVPFETPYTVSVTNSYGVNTNYYVFRTTNIINASISIAVS
jgi:hypothetical protein